ncbi:MAG: SprT-like domain-containing protein [Chitinophagaceae bacterium]|nr:SprT-like domain-containing protein [Chitinophagaceae bacterium]
MPKKEAPLDAIKKFIPEAAAQQVLNYLHHYKVHLTVTRDRKSVLGDYRHATNFQSHRISVNGSLNKYSFLITLVHELAHLVTFMKFRNRVDPHGREWKDIYAMLLKDFLRDDIFPPDLIVALKKSMHNLPASSCSDEDLMRALKKYDHADGRVMVEQIAEGKFFEAGKDKIFRKGKKLRKRYQCVEIATGKLYLFSPIYEVKVVDLPVS